MTGYVSLRRRRAAPASPYLSPSTTTAIRSHSNDCQGDLEAASKVQKELPGKSVEFMSLPSELHVEIAKYLIYPDALALKHTSSYFYSFVETGVRLKVDWLVRRQLLSLTGPSGAKVSMRTDEEFCQGNVSRLIHDRRKHIECASRPDLGCIVQGTLFCENRRNSLWSRVKTPAWLKKLTPIHYLLCSIVIVPYFYALWRLMDDLRYRISGPNNTDSSAAV